MGTELVLCMASLAAARLAAMTAAATAALVTVFPPLTAAASARTRSVTCCMVGAPAGARRGVPVQPRTTAEVVAGSAPGKARAPGGGGSACLNMDGKRTPVYPRERVALAAPVTSPSSEAGGGRRAVRPEADRRRAGREGS